MDHPNIVTVFDCRVAARGFARRPIWWRGVSRSFVRERYGPASEVALKREQTRIQREKEAAEREAERAKAREAEAAKGDAGAAAASDDEGWEDDGWE